MNWPFHRPDPPARLQRVQEELIRSERECGAIVARESRAAGEGGAADTSSLRTAASTDWHGAFQHMRVRGERHGRQGSVVYPSRCQVVDVTGGKIGPLSMHTPDESRPHVGKLGTARLFRHDGQRSYSVVVFLDDGSSIEGCSCWWVPLKTDADAPSTVKC